MTLDNTRISVGIRVPAVNAGGSREAQAEQMPCRVAGATAMAMQSKFWRSAHRNVLFVQADADGSVNTLRKPRRSGVSPWHTPCFLLGESASAETRVIQQDAANGCSE